MARSWYYAEGKQKIGPLSAAQLRQFAAAGRVQPTTMVLQEGRKHWVPASSVRGLFSSAPPAGPTAAPAAAGQGAGNLKGLLNDLLVSLGVPKLGEPWSTKQKVIGIFAGSVLFSFVLAFLMLYGMYRLLALWFTNRPKVVTRQRLFPPFSGSTGGVLQPPSGAGPVRSEPYDGGIKAAVERTSWGSPAPTQVSGYGCVIVRVGTDSVVFRDKCESCGYVDNSTMTVDKPSPSSRITGAFTCFKCGAFQERVIEGS
jgi:hypothetical protein